MSIKAKSIHETPDLKMAPPIGIKVISHMQYMKLTLIRIQLKRRNRTGSCSCCHFATLSNITEYIKKLWKILQILNNLVAFSTNDTKSWSCSWFPRSTSFIGIRITKNNKNLNYLHMFEELIQLSVFEINTRQVAEIQIRMYYLN